MGLIHLAKLNSVLARWPEPNAGWPGIVRWAAYFALDFFGSFVSRQKERNVHMRGVFHKVIIVKNISS